VPVVDRIGGMIDIYQKLFTTAIECIKVVMYPRNARVVPQPIARSLQSPTYPSRESLLNKCKTSREHVIECRSTTLAGM